MYIPRAQFRDSIFKLKSKTNIAELRFFQQRIPQLTAYEIEDLKSKKVRMAWFLQHCYHLKFDHVNVPV